MTRTRTQLRPTTRRALFDLRAELSQLPWHFARDGQGWLLRPLTEALLAVSRDLGRPAFKAASSAALGPLPKADLHGWDVAYVVAELDRRAEHIASHQLAELLERLLDAFEGQAAEAA